MTYYQRLNVRGDHLNAGKRLTKSQKIHVASLGMDPAGWLISKKEACTWAPFVAKGGLNFGETS